MMIQPESPTWRTVHGRQCMTDSARLRIDCEFDLASDRSAGILPVLISTQTIDQRKQSIRGGWQGNFTEFCECGGRAPSLLANLLHFDCDATSQSFFFLAQSQASLPTSHVLGFFGGWNTIAWTHRRTFSAQLILRGGQLELGDSGLISPVGHLIDREVFIHTIQCRVDRLAGQTHAVCQTLDGLAKGIERIEISNVALGHASLSRKRSSAASIFSGVS
ncbi:hypothetical protein RB6833 [Rhodopirellula baltica SH 1]|uniref:Uncharacterized protein n=1 Tax=Rhodopirellula baltica (strain DSM 10527 / NCIMB 13988 / SH1) TaxID=243090 RepID=Q7UPM8_RHOBA|nr:hypothetical protein RB6833 [Rhodopirellula baltica SH 1]